MGILDFFSNKKNKEIIKTLGFNNPTPEKLYVPIRNKDEAKENLGHLLILERLQIVNAIDTIEKNRNTQLFNNENNDKAITKAFIRWIKNTHQTDHVVLSHSFARFAKTSYEFLTSKQFLSTKVPFSFYCNNCRKAYPFKPDYVSLKERKNLVQEQYINKKISQQVYEKKLEAIKVLEGDPNFEEKYGYKANLRNGAIIYGEVYCPKGHLVFREFMLRFNLGGQRGSD